MPVTAQHVRETVDAYLAEHPDENDSLSALIRTLDQAGDTIASRKEFRGHVTAGAVLLRPDGRVLTIEHRVLREWLLPGGHVEECDTTLVDAALRELEEETGIAPDRVEPDSGLPLHIDVHTIPANPGRGSRGIFTSISGSCSARRPTWSSCEGRKSRRAHGSSPTR
ncbi:NUDIX domain-containing protein [Streptomyces sp. NPDC094034]|uniref:NUDIX hydrolase n=1 Tax=Streptomyces sp. NPDC094034 TaxID=3155309 RepID=UPI00332616D1